MANARVGHKGHMMTPKQEAALRQARECLDGVRRGDYDGNAQEAIAAIDEALAEQPQEPKKFDPNESFAREEAAQARVREFMRNH